MYIQLLSFPTHYLVLVITDDDFRYALIHVAVLESPVTTLVMEDIGWLNVKRIRGESEYTITEDNPSLYPVPSLPRRKGDPGDGQEKRSGKWVPKERFWLAPGTDLYSSFTLDNQLLRELYAYCW
jgi:mediator of RNA polymerase II transcription subunit 14